MGKERLQCIVSTSGQMMTWNAERKKETTGEGNYCHNKDKSSVPLCNHTKKNESKLSGRTVGVFCCFWG